jgi:hypothetical protein
MTKLVIIDEEFKNLIVSEFEQNNETFLKFKIGKNQVLINEYDALQLNAFVNQFFENGNFNKEII